MVSQASPINLLKRELLFQLSRTQIYSSFRQPYLRKRQHDPLSCLSQHSRYFPRSCSFTFLLICKTYVHEGAKSTLFSSSTALTPLTIQVQVTISLCFTVSTCSCSYLPNWSPWSQSCPLFPNPPEKPLKHIYQTKLSLSSWSFLMISYCTWKKLPTLHLSHNVPGHLFLTYVILFLFTHCALDKLALFLVFKYIFALPQSLGRPPSYLCMMGSFRPQLNATISGDPYK